MESSCMESESEEMDDSSLEETSFDGDEPSSNAKYAKKRILDISSSRKQARDSTLLSRVSKHNSRIDDAIDKTPRESNRCDSCKIVSHHQQNPSPKRSQTSASPLICQEWRTMKSTSILQVDVPLLLPRRDEGNTFRTKSQEDTKRSLPADSCLSRSCCRCNSNRMLIPSCLIHSLRVLDIEDSGDCEFTVSVLFL
jgi:hypothetical protein